MKKEIFSTAIITVFIASAFFPTHTAQASTTTTENPLSITYMRQQTYPGSDLKIEQKLLPGSNYDQYIASYQSEGLKIFGLLTIPQGPKPTNGWPVIIFNHGYIRPNLYKTTEKYILYVDAFASNGYIVFKPDFRGHGNSQGLPESQYFSPAYTIDALNALATLKKYPIANPNKIGMWGHSDGGNLILRIMVVNTKDIKAAVIWGGVVAPYKMLTTDWQKFVPYQQPKEDLEIENKHMDELISTYGTPLNNPNFWNSIDPFNFLKDTNTPLELDAGGSDEEVPPFFSANLKLKLFSMGKPVVYYYYPGKNHNISYPPYPPAAHIAVPYSVAINRAVKFFDKYLK
jgi:dipeptidyl aminopeptidase/acylaminoacyl peptidase